MKTETPLRCPYCDNTVFKNIDKHGAKECTLCRHHVRLNSLRGRMFDADYFLKFMKDKTKEVKHA